jgi:hypothetical protein
VTSGSPTPTTAASGLEDVQTGADANEAAEARTDDLKADGGVLCEPIEITYRNYRGEVSQRRIVPQRVWFGASEWHPEPQWMLDALDVDKGERSFALRDVIDFGAAGFRRVPEDAETVERIAKGMWPGPPEWEATSVQTLYGERYRRMARVALDAVRGVSVSGGGEQP